MSTTDSNTSRWTRRRVLGLGAAAAGALLVGCGDDGEDGQPAPGDTDGWAGTLLDPPFERPDVTLLATDGTSFPFREATKGKLTVLFFGFTSCPDVCPIFLNNLSVGRGLIGDGPGSEPQVLFVGVDTARDTPAAMDTYLANTDESFTGLTGDPAEIDAAIAALKMAPVEIGEPDADGNYDVGHPARIYVFSPDDLAHRLYAHDVTPKQWAADLPTLARGEWT